MNFRLYKLPFVPFCKFSPIYEISCKNCNKTYIRESGRPLKKRVMEHKKTIGPLTTVGEHVVETGHRMDWKDIKILGTETTWLSRKIKESIEISTHNPQINDNSGYKLSPLYSTLHGLTHQPPH